MSALRPARMLPPVRGLSSSVDFGGELLEVVTSLASSDDILRHFSHDEGPHHSKAKRLGQLMQVNVITASPDTPLKDVEARLKGIEGLPVVDAAGKLVGVLSRKDLQKGGSVVQDVMSAQPIAMKATDRASAAAHSMIDHKIHRLPVVDDEGKCVGIITRTDIFWALASDSDRTNWFHEYGINV